VFVSKTDGLHEKLFCANVCFIILYTFFCLNTLPSVTCLIDQVWFLGRLNNKWAHKNKRENFTDKLWWTENTEGAYIEGVLDAEVEMQDLFVHRQHSEGATFIKPRKPHYPDSYCVRCNDRRITLQAQFSGPQEWRGSIQEHRLQLKFHAEVCIQRYSLDNPNNKILIGLIPLWTFVDWQRMWVISVWWIRFIAISYHIIHFFSVDMYRVKKSIWIWKLSLIYK
jgi:hypothetical protein